MNELIAHVNVLAQLSEEKLRALRQGFVEQSTGDNSLILLTVVVICLVGLGIVIVRQYQRSRAERTRRHVDLFTSSLTHLAFTESDASVLRHVAKHANLREPTSMLLSPANLRFALESAGSYGAGETVRQRVEQISVELFGVGLPSAQSPPN